MKILIDIGHPAHVHYFKNFIKIMEDKGHRLFIISRDKEISFQLLNAYAIPFKSRGKGRDTILGKFLYLYSGANSIRRFSKKNNIDLYLSFASPYNAISSIFYRKPNISLDDTEHNILNHKIYAPLSDSILTPIDFKKDYGKKQIKFDSTMDIAYLHPKYFKPDKNILEELNIRKSKKLFLVRFVSWSASHDLGFGGFTLYGKRKLISMLSKKGKVLISSESKLPKEFEPYAVQIEPHKMHNLMYYCDLFVGESGSMATEAAVLGTPSIIVNSSAKLFGVFERIKKYKTLFIYEEEAGAIEKVKELMSSNFKENARKAASKILENSIDVTAFMVWFIENYPQSVETMKENPDYQYRFK